MLCVDRLSNKLDHDLNWIHMSSHDPGNKFKSQQSNQTLSQAQELSSISNNSSKGYDSIKYVIFQIPGIQDSMDFNKLRDEWSFL